MEIPWCVALSRWEGWLLRCSLHFLCEDPCFSWALIHMGDRSIMCCSVCCLLGDIRFFCELFVLGCVLYTLPFIPINLFFFFLQMFLLRLCLGSQNAKKCRLPYAPRTPRTSYNYTWSGRNGTLKSYIVGGNFIVHRLINRNGSAYSTQNCVTVEHRCSGSLTLSAKSLKVTWEGGHYP